MDVGRGRGHVGTLKKPQNCSNQPPLYLQNIKVRYWNENSFHTDDAQELSPNASLTKNNHWVVVSATQRDCLRANCLYPTLSSHPPRLGDNPIQ